MMLDRLIHAAALAASLLLAVSPAAGAEEKPLPPPAQGEVEFARDIEPLLSKHCLKCHGPKEQESGFRLDSREALLKGGDIGKPVVPGKSAESPLIRYVAGVDKEITMPPEGDPLTAREVGLLRAWIDQGLKWSEQVAAKPAAAAAASVLKTLKGQTRWVTALAFDREGKTLATVGGETLLFKPGEVKVWDMATQQVKATLDGHEKTVWTVAFDREGKTLATGGYDKVVKLWDLAQGKERATLSGHANWVTCLAYSPDGRLLATGSEDTTVKLWDSASGKEEATLKGHGATVRALAFSPDSSVLATASFDRTVKLWDVAKREELATLKGHEDAVWAVAFSPDGKSLATGSADATVRLWGWPEGQPRAATEAGVLKGHTNWVSSVAFSPDGKRLASSGFDGSARVWSVAGQMEAAAVTGQKSTVWSVAFGPGGKTLALGLGAVEGEESTVKFWEIPRDRRY